MFENAAKIAEHGCGGGGVFWGNGCGGPYFGIPAVTHLGSGLKAAAVTTWASSQIPVPDSATSWRVCPCHAHTVAPNNLRHQTSPFNGSTAKPTRKNTPPKSGRKGQTLFRAF